MFNILKWPPQQIPIPFRARQPFAIFSGSCFPRWTDSRSEPESLPHFSRFRLLIFNFLFLHFLPQPSVEFRAVEPALGPEYLGEIFEGGLFMRKKLD